MPLKVPLPTYTTDDLRRFPDDGFRYELLDGMLLVTPGPAPAHQVILGRLLVLIAGYLGQEGPARAVSPGDVEVQPKTLLEPDLLVYPSRYSLRTKWAAIREWWLAVEVLSPGSRRYDRDYKRDAYLALGVREVWLVDLDAKCVLVSREGGPRDARHTRQLMWHPAEMPEALVIELNDVFRGLD